MRLSDEARSRVKQYLASADVMINGDRPWDVQIHNDGVYSRVLALASLGLGESYVDGWWDCERLDEFFYRILRADLHGQFRSWAEIRAILKARLINLQSPSRAFQIGRHHYDMGDDLYQCMLDERRIYSCGFWEHASTLDEAQEAKLELICGKLGLQPGMRVLDIGCGWGGTAKYLAEQYDVEVVGITVSEAQYRFAAELCRGLPIQVRYEDYRHLTEHFDRILCVGMFEHVGPRNYSTFMRVVRRCLNEDGLFLLHTIGTQQSLARCDPWMSRYIFPNSKVPSATEICAAIEGRFILEDWHNLGSHYDQTLMHWFRNFEENWSILCNGYDERFFRMWAYYLLSCAGAFRARVTQLWQIVLSPRGVPGGYRMTRDVRGEQDPGRAREPCLAAWATSVR